MFLPTHRRRSLFCLLNPPPCFAGNALKHLPASIAALSSLRTLRLSDNTLAVLPQEVASLPLLTEVHVGGNSGLDRKGVAEVLRQRPGITIVWDEGDKEGAADSCRALGAAADR